MDCATVLCLFKQIECYICHIAGFHHKLGMVCYDCSLCCITLHTKSPDYLLCLSSLTGRVISVEGIGPACPFKVHNPPVKKTSNDDVGYECMLWSHYQLEALHWNDFKQLLVVVQLCLYTYHIWDTINNSCLCYTHCIHVKSQWTTTTTIIIIDLLKRTIH